MAAPRLILASRSPRRARLLRDAGFIFRQADPPFADPAQPAGDASPRDMAVALAQAKAASVVRAGLAGGDDVVLASDTIVVGPRGELIGQPGDHDEARTMLQSLINQTHDVITGVALVAAGSARAAAFADTARVSLGEVPADVLDAYLAADAWRGKAGGYNLAELENDWPFTVTGDPTTVVGLPMIRLIPTLHAFGIEPAAPPAALSRTSAAERR